MSNLIYDFYSGSDLYSDGDIEDEILLAVKNKDQLEEKLHTDRRWAFQYHLNPRRHEILNVCNILPTDDILEIGSGCGAISTGILERCENLDSVELSKRRSLINAERNENHRFHNIYVGNFDDVKLTKKYDKILLIGVLEYSLLYFPKAQNPFMHMLKKVKDLLKENGELFIAIENKYGMKYFSGATEDHSGRMFEGMEGYSGNGAKTFSKNELTALLHESGYGYVYFYYPMPDYKFPVEIFSEDYLPKANSFPYLGSSYDRNRFVFFSEEKAMAEASKSQDFETFANSFLVKCR